MAKPAIFTISAARDDEASVCTLGIATIFRRPPTLDELLAKISAMAFNLIARQPSRIDPGDLVLQITAVREAEPAAA
jgi:hypothetical protein